MAVRRAGVGERDALRTLRLRALRDAPAAFGSTYEREAAFADDVWDTRLATAHNALFLATADDGTPVGMTGGVRADADARTAELVGLWVEPAARGTGAADALVAAVVDWATAAGVATLTLYVTEGNDRAEALYARHGFTRTGTSIVRARDGATELEMARPIEEAR